MTDEQSLILVLFLLYFVECIVWIPRNSIAVMASFRSTWRYFFPSVNLGNAQGGFLLLDLFPTLGTVFQAQPWPISLSSQGVCSYISQSLTEMGQPKQIAKLFRYEDIQNIKFLGRKILINGKLFVKCVSERAASYLTNLIQHISHQPLAAREEIIFQAIRESLDIKKIEQIIKRFRTTSGKLRIYCNVLWFYLFLVCPFLVWYLGFLRVFFPLIPGIILLQYLILSRFHYLYQDLDPGGLQERGTHLLKMSLCPPIAMRAVDIISRDLLDLFHPMAIVTFLCPEKTAQDFIRKVISDLRYPLRPDFSKELYAVSDWFREVFIRIFEEFLVTREISIDLIMRRNFSPADKHGSYCPRCYSEYTVSSGQCLDCGGVILLQFSEVNSSHKESKN